MTLFRKLIDSHVNRYFLPRIPRIRAAKVSIELIRDFSLANPASTDTFAKTAFEEIFETFCRTVLKAAVRDELIISRARNWTAIDLCYVIQAAEAQTLPSLMPKQAFFLKNKNEQSYKKNFLEI